MNKQDKLQSFLGNTRAAKYMVIIVGGVCLVSLLANLVTVSHRGFITEKQAEKIAYGISLRSCVQKAKPEVDCRELKLINTYKLQDTFDGSGSWTFSYDAGTGPHTFIDSVRLSFKGGVLPDSYPVQ